MIKPILVVGILALAGLAWWWMQHTRAQASEQVSATLYSDPLPAPDHPLRVFHLGHSLVGRDMPAMLEQLAGAGHEHQSQLGWGTSLKQHWEPAEPINGFDVENNHPRFRPAREAVASGDYDAIVLTEMVEIKDAIKYHQSGTYFPLWVNLARDAGADTRVYLYETWHNTDDPAGWLTRIDSDFTRYWQKEVLFKAHTPEGQRPAYLIPGGQVMAQFARALDDAGGVDGIQNIDDLFILNADGTRDTIHLNDLGNYLIALVHYAVLYHRSPVGLPRQLIRADGTAATAPNPEAAQLMQTIAWEIVSTLPQTGVAQ